MPAIAEATILILATDGFEECELFGPREILLSQGARMVLASPSLAPIQATVLDDPGRVIRPDLRIADVDAGRFDALILPGGVRNPDSLRRDAAAIALIRSFADRGKPVAAICHGPWLLVEADMLRGRRATSWPAIRTDLVNAGADFSDDPVVVDGMLVTARGPEDVSQFTAALIARIEGQSGPI